MIRSGKKRIAYSVLSCSAVILLAAWWFGNVAEGQDAKRAGVSVEQAIACIRTATTAKPGDVRVVEVEREVDKTICEVEIITEDGKTYEVEVDAATNAVLEVEEDDEDEDENEDDEDEDESEDNRD